MQPPNGGRGRPAPVLTRLAISQPWVVVGTWIVIVAVLATIGLGIDGKLSAGGLQVSNSESSRARALIGGNFGDTATMPVLLRGPRADVKTQGKALSTRLSRRPGLRVLSPWTASAGRSALRPSSDRALLLVSVSGTHDEIAARSERVEALVDRATKAPVRSTVTGLPLLTRDGTTSSLAAVHRAELIALPLLLIALLLVFRSPLAAAIPALFGAATIAASTGALALLAAQIRLDAFALAVSCMVGLALAVDYSLLFVSRLREELRDDPHVDVETRSAAPPRRRRAPSRPPPPRSSWRWPSPRRCRPERRCSRPHWASASSRSSPPRRRCSSSPRCSSSSARGWRSARSPPRAAPASARSSRAPPPTGPSSASAPRAAGSPRSPSSG